MRLKTILLCVLGAMYLGNNWVMRALFPDASKDPYVYIAMTLERNKVYELMFTGFFLVSFLDMHRTPKAVACFFLILTCGSFIDKTVFNITHYLISDAILAIVAVIISIYVYVRENPGHPQ